MKTKTNTMGDANIAIKAGVAKKSKENWKEMVTLQGTRQQMFPCPEADTGRPELNLPEEAKEL